MQGLSNPNFNGNTRFYLLAWLLFIFSPALRAQNNPLTTQPPSRAVVPDTPAADLSKIAVLDDLAPQTWICFSSDKNIQPAQLPFLPYKKGTRRYEHFIAPSLINKKVVLKFTLDNTSDTVQNAFFCPGYLIDTIRLFQLPGSTIPAPTSFEPAILTSAAPARGPTPIPVPSILPDDPDSLGYRKITLGPHQRTTFFALLSYIKANTNSVNPSVTRDTLIRSAIIISHKYKSPIDLITNLFAGVMLMMIFYAISEFIQTGKPEFIYYVGYALCTSALLFLKSILHEVTTVFNFAFESFWDNIIFCIGYICYIVFHRKFLETKTNYRTLDRYLFWGSIGLTILMVLYIFFYTLSPDFTIANTIEAYTRIFLLVVSVVFIIKGLTYRNQLMNYIVLGNISLCLLSIISEVLIMTNFKVVKGRASIFNLALFYYEFGITIELLFFLFALTYKNKMEIITSIQKEEKSKLDAERKDMEKQVAVLAAKQDERNRISVDMHDELGSGVTAIRLMSEIVKSKMKEQTLLPEIEKISNSANELLNKMNTIIWTMTSSNDTIENLVAYMRSYAVEFFENTTIDCYFSMPASLPSREISGERRRNIFLSVKESLNNVLKHSQGSVVRINIVVDDRLMIEIQDNGVGIDMDKLRKFGNGLNNMKKRMSSIDGEFNIENREGTRTTFYLTL